MIYQTIFLLALSAIAQDINFNGNCGLNCPADWIATSCGVSGVPDFCCPGSIINNICCIGSTNINQGSKCSGTAVTAGSDLGAYTSSVSAALSSYSSTASSDDFETVIGSQPASTQVTIPPVVVFGSTAFPGTTIGSTGAVKTSAAPSAGTANPSSSTGAAMPARTAGAQLAGLIAGAGMLLI